MHAIQAATGSTWRAPEVEAMAKTTNEGNRFFNTCPEERKVGLRYVPPPAANL